MSRLAPLVDSSSDDHHAAGAAPQSESSEEASADECDDFQGVFQQMMMRAQAGPGWNRQPGAFVRGRLALQDRAPQRISKDDDCNERFDAQHVGNAL